MVALASVHGELRLTRPARETGGGQALGAAQGPGVGLSESTRAARGLIVTFARDRGQETVARGETGQETVARSGPGDRGQETVARSRPSFCHLPLAAAQRLPERLRSV